MDFVPISPQTIILEMKKHFELDFLKYLKLLYHDDRKLKCSVKTIFVETCSKLKPGIVGLIVMVTMLI